MTRPIPEYGLDIFTPQAVIDAREVDDTLRELAPVVRLADGTHMLGRHEHVAAGLLDWKAFSSTSRPWHDPTSPRPEILLTEWLNAIVYEMATRRMLFCRFQVRIDGERLTGTAWGEAVDVPRHRPAVEVKGATLTQLRVAQEPDGTWVAQCVVDV